MSLSIKQNFVTDLENFTWGKDWRATRIIKEKRTNGEYYFADIIRYYGEENVSHDYDVGDTMAEMAILGRNEKFVGKKKEWVTDPYDETKRKRVHTEAVTEIIEEPDYTGKPVKREVLVEGKTIYEYNLKVTPESTKKMQTLAGPIALNQETQFLFVYGAVPPLVVDPKTFWDVSVSDYLNTLKPIQTTVQKTKK